MDLIQNIIQLILNQRQKAPGSPTSLKRSHIQFLCSTIFDLFLDQPSFLELRPPLIVVGDIHGQFHDLLRIFDTIGHPPSQNFLFLGDYVDRGFQSIDSICLLFAYKLLYPENFFLLRGNHECAYINKDHGFYDEVLNSFDASIWRLFNEVFSCMPIAASIDHQIFCVHGGLSPKLRDLNQLKLVSRPFEIPLEGMLCDIFWSDPKPGEIGWTPSSRGASYFFGEVQVQKFLQKFDYELIVRAHQATMSGFDFPFQSTDGLVTVFSAPNYCYTYKNKGAVMCVNEDLQCTFTVFQPKFLNVITPLRPGTPPRGQE